MQLYKQHIYEWMPYGFNISSFIVFTIPVMVIAASVIQKKRKDISVIRTVLFMVLTFSSRIYTPYLLLSTVVLVGNVFCHSPKAYLKILHFFLFFTGCSGLLYLWAVSLTTGLNYSSPILFFILIVLIALALSLEDFYYKHLSLTVLIFCALFALATWGLALFWGVHAVLAVAGTALLLALLYYGYKNSGIKRLSAIVLLFCTINLFIIGLPSDLEEVAREEGYPVAAVEKCKNYKVFNHYDWGGYLIWKGIPVYIDGRTDLYAHNNILKNYNDLLTAADATVLERTGANAVLTYSDSSLRNVLSKSAQWEIIHEDRCSVLFRKKQ
jgi:hypothetical protein